MILIILVAIFDTFAHVKSFLLPGLPLSPLCLPSKIASTLLPIGLTESRYKSFFTVYGTFFRKLFLQVEMRKVGVDGGAANGSTGGTKRSAPGHGPPKNRSLQEILI